MNTRTGIQRIKGSTVNSLSRQQCSERARSEKRASECNKNGIRVNTNGARSFRRVCKCTFVGAEKRFQRGRGGKGAGPGQNGGR